MRRLLGVALTLILSIEALALLSVPRAWHCACPIKSACCKLDVCPMEAARHQHGETSLETCGGGVAHSVVPPFIRRTAVPAERIALVAPVTLVRDAVAPNAVAIERHRELDDPPPRTPPFSLA